MNKTLLASVAVLSLALAAPAFAQDANAEVNANATVGAAGGGGTGAVVGAIVGGPIGAVIGGFAGAVIGAEAGVAATTVDYATAHPVSPVVIDGTANVGYVVPETVTINPVDGDPAYGYIYANGRVWIVDMNSRALVQSPGYVVSQASLDYAVNNPVGSVNAQGDVVVGTVLPGDVTLTAVPDDTAYGYVYLNDRPALVDMSSRTVVWVR